MVQTISKSQLVDFFHHHPLEKYEKGEIVLDYNAYSPVVCYMNSGYVRAYSISSEGRERIYVFYQPNDIFPIVWTFNDVNKQLLYEAMDTVTVYKIKRDEFLTFIKNKPDVLLEVIHRIVDRHSVYVDRVDNLCHTHGRERVITSFLALGKRFGKQEGNGVLIQLPVTHADIANSTAMTRETVSREIETLQEKDILYKHNNLFVIKSMEKLEKELHKEK